MSTHGTECHDVCVLTAAARVGASHFARSQVGGPVTGPAPSQKSSGNRDEGAGTMPQWHVRAFQI